MVVEMPDPTSQQRRAVADAFRELFHTRYWLCLQLERASDMIDEEEFEKRAAPFWKHLKNTRDLPEARAMAHHLFDAGVHDIDAEELSVMLNCELRTANEIIRELQNS